MIIAMSAFVRVYSGIINLILPQVFVIILITRSIGLYKLVLIIQ